MLIPYGASRLHPHVLEMRNVADGGVELKCAIPHVVVSPDEKRTLRLSDACYDFSGQMLATDVSAPLDSLAVLRTQIENLCDLWGRPARIFISRYFDFIAAHVDHHRAELERRLEPFGGFYTYRDWIFSAPAPLPRAWLLAPRIRATPPSLDSYVFADFAFWINGKATAVYLSGAETPTAASRERSARLRAAGVAVHDITGKSMKSGAARCLLDDLPWQFQRFWERESFPSGPFRNSMLRQVEDL